MPTAETINVQTLTPYVKKFVPKRVYTAKPKATITHGYKSSRNQTKGELLANDTNITQNHVQVGVMTLLNGISQGDDINNRKGRKINLKSFHIKGGIYTLATSVADQLVARMALIYDKQSNGVAPTFAQVYSDSTGHAGSTRNLDNRERFKVIFEKSWYSGPNTSQCYPLDIYKSFNLDTVYKGTDDAIASIATGALYLFIWGADLADTANHGMQTRATARIRYMDQ